MENKHLLGKVSVAFLNLRDSPDGEVIKVLPQFTRVKIINRAGNWLDVLVENQRGYVSANYITVENNKIIPEKKLLKGKITASKLNVRNIPGGEIIDTLSKNTEIEILSEDNEWFEIITKNQIGFISTKYVALDEVSKVRQGKVSVSKLNLREIPAGEIIKTLPEETRVTILSEEDGWLKVQVNELDGYVSKQYIDEETDSDKKTSVITTATPKFQFVDKSAIAPDGEKFGTKFRKGIYHYGETSIKDFVDENRSLFPAELNSYLNVMIAASDNEGKYEAINTWDNCFLSFGVFQWTCGTTTAKGELPALLDRLQQTYPDTFEKYFGQYGLSTDNISHRKSVAARGYFKLNNQLLNSPEAKSKLRTLPWAYRFWSAGFDNSVREVETLHAIDRVNLFYRQDNRKINDFYVADYVTSEYGIALLLDQHVNRPGHVPKTLLQAVNALSEQLAINNPQSWGDEEEEVLINKYLQLREKTSMTHSSNRAKTIQDKIETGIISSKRGSFKEASLEETQFSA